MSNLATVLGFIGSLLVIGLYWCTTEGILKPTGPKYLWANLLAASLLGISLVYHPNIGSITIEIFWAIISIRALIIYYHNK